MTQFSEGDRTLIADYEKSERREYVRYLCSANGCDEVVAVLGKDRTIVTVRDISISGVGLVVDYELERGLLIATKLCNSSRQYSVRRVLEVVRAVLLGDGKFLIGCKFTLPMTYNQLRLLLSETA